MTKSKFLDQTIKGTQQCDSWNQPLPLIFCPCCASFLFGKEAPLHATNCFSTPHFCWNINACPAPLFLATSLPGNICLFPGRSSAIWHTLSYPSMPTCVICLPQQPVNSPRTTLGSPTSSELAGYQTKQEFNKTWSRIKNKVTNNLAIWVAISEMLLAFPRQYQERWFGNQ